MSMRQEDSMSRFLGVQLAKEGRRKLGEERGWERSSA
jgi:hypothetical protein